MTVIDPYTVNLHVLFLFFSLKTFPAAAMNLRHFPVKKKKKKSHSVCTHFLFMFILKFAEFHALSCMLYVTLTPLFHSECFCQSDV